jgi:N-acetylglucosaminyldiphosphoundecaprenol N-acetyl-beta-D-mannosaminyltransferase
MRRPPALVCGIPIADLTLDETLELVDELVSIGRERATSHQIATVNVDFLVNAIDDDAVADILRGADVCLADGMPVVWATRWLGTPIAGRVAGSDLVPLLIDASRSRHWNVYVFGSAPDVADDASQLLADRFPGARFTIDPGPMIDDVEHIDDEVLDTIARADPDILCVALGNPKQERFIAAHRDRLAIPVMIGVGGSLDMLVGKRRRAPVWMQRLGLEWVARAVQEPRRLGRRYAHDIRIFGPTVAREWRAARRRRDGSGVELATGTSRVEVRFRDGPTATNEEWGAASSMVCGGAELDIDVDHPRPPRLAAIAQTVGLVALARRQAGTVNWREVPEDTVRAVTATGVTPVMLGAPPEWPSDRVG